MTFSLSALVLDDDGTAVLVQSEAVDAPAVLLSRGVLGGKEPDPKQGLHVIFHELLERPLQGHGLTRQLTDFAARGLEQLDVAHDACSGCHSRTSILPVTAAEMRAVRRSWRRAMTDVALS